MVARGLVVPSVKVLHLPRIFAYWAEELPPLSVAAGPILVAALRRRIVLALHLRHLGPVGASWSFPIAVVVVPVGATVVVAVAVVVVATVPIVATMPIVSLVPIAIVVPIVALVPIDWIVISALASAFAFAFAFASFIRAASFSTSFAFAAFALAAFAFAAFAFAAFVIASFNYSTRLNNFD